jgi:hypothetical protein
VKGGSDPALFACHARYAALEIFCNRCLALSAAEKNGLIRSGFAIQLVAVLNGA